MKKLVLLTILLLTVFCVSCSDGEKISIKYASENEVIYAAENAAFIYAAGNNMQIIERETTIVGIVDDYDVYKVKVSFENSYIYVFVSADAKYTQLFEFDYGLFDNYKK